MFLGDFIVMLVFTRSFMLIGVALIFKKFELHENAKQEA